MVRQISQVPTEASKHRVEAVAAPWSVEPARFLETLDVDTSTGLNEQEIEQRRRKFGDNGLQPAPPRSRWSIFASQWQSFVMLLLVFAAGVSIVLGDLTEAFAIFVVVCINVAIGFATELRAVRSMESLRALTETRAKVMRSGQLSSRPASELVLGDIIRVEAGDLFPADVRLVQCANLQVDESSLTGESVPVEKSVASVPPETLLADRRSMGYRGTQVTRGVATAVVSDVGIHTELGRIAEMLDQVPVQKTPLERGLDRFGGKLAWIALGLVSLIALGGLMQGAALLAVLETAIALAIATVPEGLPVVATIALARGMFRMAKQNALVTKLAAVETLGSVSVVISDKTGTLTENQMTVHKVALADGLVALDASNHPPSLRNALKIAVACNDAQLDREGESGVGDPMEIALLRAGFQASVTADQLPVRTGEHAFDPDTRRMATIHQQDHSSWVAVKGAPEAVLEACSDESCEGSVKALNAESRGRWVNRGQEMANSGLRVIAVAERHGNLEDTSPYGSLTMVGLFGLVDPPRKDIAPALEQCRQAGIRVVVLTGDQQATARHVCGSVGLLGDDSGPAVSGADIEFETSEGRAIALRSDLIFRATPEQKLRVIELHQNHGSIVAMLGDGVNDAPALRKADIGVAMGLRGTTVAQQAAAMVLRDDRFSTIVGAISEGRTIFDNIRKFVVYLLSCNVGELVAVGLSFLLPIPVALTALQILFLNLVTDVFPALALGVSEGAAGTMSRAPRSPKEPILNGRRWLQIAIYGALMTGVCLGTLYVAVSRWELPHREAVTLAFLTLAFAQLFHVFNMAETDAPLLNNEVTRNPWVWGALVLCTALLLLAIHVKPLAQVLSLVPPSFEGWGLVLISSLGPLGFGLVWRGIAQRVDRT